MVRVSSPGALEFACHSKACAPPPVGSGGSKGGKVTAQRQAQLDSLLKKTGLGDIQTGPGKAPHDGYAEAAKTASHRKACDDLDDRLMAVCKGRMGMIDDEVSLRRLVDEGAAETGVVRFMGRNVGLCHWAATRFVEQNPDYELVTGYAFVPARKVSPYDAKRMASYYSVKGNTVQGYWTAHTWARSKSGEVVETTGNVYNGYYGRVVPKDELKAWRKEIGGSPRRLSGFEDFGEVPPR